MIIVNKQKKQYTALSLDSISFNSYLEFSVCAQLHYFPDKKSLMFGKSVVPT